MTLRTKGILVMVVQLAIVLSIAVKYAWERHSCPAVWVRSAQYDPEQPLRGRYLSLTLHADACDLPRTDEYAKANFFNYSALENHAFASQNPWYTWQVFPTARDGKLTGVLAPKLSPGDSMRLRLAEGLPCEYAALDEHAEFFISDRAKTPFPLKRGQELWTLVTVPPSGPPRPIRLALSQDGKDFHALDLR